MIDGNSRNLRRYTLKVRLHELIAGGGGVRRRRDRLLVIGLAAVELLAFII
jgi:hypothetical protein